MAHLACKRHGKRVMVLPSGNVIHRQNGANCLATILTIGGKTVTVGDVYRDRVRILDRFSYFYR